MSAQTNPAWAGKPCLTPEGRRNNRLRIVGCVFGALLLTGAANRAESGTAEPVDPVRIRSEQWALDVSPSTLEISATTPDGRLLRVASPVAGLGTVSVSAREKDRLTLEYPDRKATVVLAASGSELATTITVRDPGSFTWPVIEVTTTAKALILPRAEGCYVPLDDPVWIDYLVDHGGWSTLEGLSMPFWGIDCGGHSLTYIATNPYHNEILFEQTTGTLQLRFTHEFTPNRAPHDYGFVIRLGENKTPVEPALAYREFLERENRFVPMKEKLARTPKAERLLGAAHVYLWGDAFLTRYDVGDPSKPKANLWKPFCATLIAESGSTVPMVARQVKALMEPAKWVEVVNLSNAEWPDRFLTGEVAAGLNKVLESPAFFDEAAWRGIAIPDDARQLPARDRQSLSAAELCRLNGLLLQAAYPGYLHPVDQWGDGVSVKMLSALQEAGFDRMQLCVPGWEGVEKRPGVARRADEIGYLFGTYDSFHSIHNPKLKGTDASWATAQFDQTLFEKGAIQKRDGSKRGGFKQAGYKLSPAAARPYVEQRVNERMKRVPYNYYFVDCDAYGEVYDDYSPDHPATQQEDASERADRLAWISKAHGAVVGSEGGSCYAVPSIHVAEGIVTPVFGWGDPDLHDKKKRTEYFLGEYFPEDGPRVFLKQVPLKEKYRHLYFDPRFRLPLYETVNHDSVVSTHHWSGASLKFSDTTATVRLTELLYQVPPMYHLNLAEFENRKNTIRKHYEIFSPLHRKLGFARMTGFSWLTPDRLVQRTEFDGTTEIVANFSAAEFLHKGTVIPAGGLLVQSLGGKLKQVHVVD
jgi:hypothetical protein